MRENNRKPMKKMHAFSRIFEMFNERKRGTFSRFSNTTNIIFLSVKDRTVRLIYSRNSRIIPARL